MYRQLSILTSIDISGILTAIDTRAAWTGPGEGEIEVLYALYASSWSSALEDPTAERDRFHRVTLQEARFATERHSPDGRVSEPAGLVDRIRKAIGLAPAEIDLVFGGNIERLLGGFTPAARAGAAQPYAGRRAP